MMNACSDYCGENLYSKVDSIVHPVKLDADIAQNYASKIQSEFDVVAGIEDKMEILMQRKYIHIKIILQPYECFAELRRTVHPKLEPVLQEQLKPNCHNIFVIS
jgi:predicted transcriptional regulator YdeE